AVAVGPTLRVEGQYLKFDGQVDLTHIDPLGHTEHDRGEVEDAGHTGLDEPAGDPLRGGGRCGDHSDGHTLSTHNLFPVVNMPHFQCRDAPTDPGGVGVEQGPHQDSP